MRLQPIFFDTLVLDLYIANAEIIRKRISKLDHHTGFASQQLIVCACTAKRKGAATQCIRHKLLERIPMESDFLRYNVILQF